MQAKHTAATVTILVIIYVGPCGLCGKIALGPTTLMMGLRPSGHWPDSRMNGKIAEKFCHFKAKGCDCDSKRAELTANFVKVLNAKSF